VQSVDAALQALPVFVRDGAEKAMHMLHSAKWRRSNFSHRSRTSGVVGHSQVRALGIKCGIVGLRTSAKSTLFNAVTQAQNAAAANYPFCTSTRTSRFVPVRTWL